MKNKYAEMFTLLGTVSQAGFTMAVSVALCIWLTSWLRDKFSLGNWIVIVGALWGVASGFYSVVNIFKKAVFKGKEK